jgi:NADP-dependent 3-hydroxy acid dehydrogenase YdfG
MTATAKTSTIEGASERDEPPRIEAIRQRQNREPYHRVCVARRRLAGCTTCQTEVSAMSGKTVVIAGASGGIGSAIASALYYRTDANLILIGRNRDRMAALPDAPLKFIGDLNNEALLGSLSTTINQSNVTLHGLILSVGIYEQSDSPEILREQLTANVIGPYALLRAITPALIAGEGTVIFINSSQAIRASAAVGQYAATMHAMKAIADSFRDEINDRNVRVTTLYLGRTAGERQRKLFAFEGRDYSPERLIQPADVASIVLNILNLPKTAEITDLHIRPALKT